MSAPPRLFDRKLLRIRQRRAHTLGPETFLLDRVAQDILDRLHGVARHFPFALDLGTRGISLQQMIAASGKVGTLIACEPLVQLRQTNTCLFVTGDEETLPFAEATFDLVVSALALQWTNDLPGALVQIRRSLKPDGLLLAAVFGGETLTELRQCLALADSEIEGGISPRVAPFIEVRALGSLLQRAAFALPVSDVDRLILRYSRLTDLFHDLRRMGATNILTERRRVPLKRTVLARAAALYAERFADPDGRLRATFDILWISGWAPHGSQQQSLRPGSARMRLADALGVREYSTDEKANPRGK